MTFDISLHEVCVRVGVRYVITKVFLMDSLPNFLTHGAPQARASRERASLLRLVLAKKSIWQYGTTFDYFLEVAVIVIVRRLVIVMSVSWPFKLIF